MIDPLDAWLFIIPSLAFVFGMYLVGAGIQNGLLALGQQLAFRECIDDTISEDAPRATESP